MLDRIKNMLFAPGAKGQTQRVEAELELACAALLVEAAVLDGDFGDAERATVERLLKDRFSLSDDDTQDLMRDAQESVANSHELYTFSRTVKDNFDADQRIDLMEMLWQVVYADGVLHDYEANLVRRLSGLLYVSDRDSGEVRKRVLAQMGLE